MVPSRISALSHSLIKHCLWNNNQNQKLAGLSGSNINVHTLAGEHWYIGERKMAQFDRQEIETDLF